MTFIEWWNNKTKRETHSFSAEFYIFFFSHFKFRVIIPFLLIIHQQMVLFFRLFIPSQLSKYPAIDLNRSDELGLKVIRLYKMAFIPSGFWSRLLSRLMYRIELLTSDWILSKSLTSSVTPAKFHKMLERQSSASRYVFDSFKYLHKMCCACRK